ncbi:MAG TPA: hypothetical protein PKD00_03185 [Burkholderiales bacterium]|mgnify:CR=1 FL=1|nr:hypothetical protein [Burkholderiales bacterium]
MENYNFEIGKWYYFVINGSNNIARCDDLTNLSFKTNCQVIINSKIVTTAIVRSWDKSRISKAREITPEEAIEWLDDNQMLEFVKQYYPVGTTFKSLYNGNKYIITNDGKFESVDIGVAFILDSSTNYLIYNNLNKKFAEIITNFTLPEKWYVCPKTKENLELIKKYFNNFSGNVITYQDNSYSSDNNYFTHADTAIDLGYKEITMDQFKEYVLKTMPENCTQLKQLPEYWCIDSDYKEVYDYFNLKCNTSCYGTWANSNGYLHSHNLINKSIMFDNISVISFFDTTKRKDFTEISLDEFKKFVLNKEVKSNIPEKWAVKRDINNYDVLNDWCDSNKNVSGTNARQGWVHSINYGYDGWDKDGHYFCSNNKHPEHTEISFEDFKKFVLNEKEYPLLPDDCYKSTDIIIPKIIKKVIKQSFNLKDMELVEITIPINQKPKKIVSPVNLEKFNLNI